MGEGPTRRPREAPESRLRAAGLGGGGGGAAAGARAAGTHEAVAAGLAGLAVGDDHGLLDVSEALEVLSERCVGGVVGQAAHEDLGERGVLLRAVHGAGGGGRPREYARGTRGLQQHRGRRYRAGRRMRGRRRPNPTPPRRPAPLFGSPRSAYSEPRGLPAAFVAGHAQRPRPLFQTRP